MPDSLKDVPPSENTYTKLTTSLMEKLHLYERTATKLAQFSLDYVEQTGEIGSKIDESNFQLILSINNTVVEFSPEKGSKLAIKMFSSAEEGLARFEAESTGKEFILNTGLFGVESNILLPKIIMKDEVKRLVIMEFIDDLNSFRSIDPITKLPQGLIVDFLVRLNELRATPSNLEQYSNRSRYSKDSVYEVYQNTIERYERFKEWLEIKGNKTTLEWCNKNRLTELFESRLDLLTRSVDPVILHKRTDPKDLRFNWGDVSFPNMLFKVIDGKKILVPVDMEYAGWDHLSGGISSLLMHHSSEWLTSETQLKVLNKFIENSRFSEEEISELYARIQVADLLFIARKFNPVMKPAFETPGLTQYPRQWGESWIAAKIGIFLEPAVERLLKNPLLR